MSLSLWFKKKEINCKNDGTDVRLSLKTTLSTLLQGLLRIHSFFKDVCQEHVFSKDVKALSNPPIHNQPVVSGDKGAPKSQETASNNIHAEYGLQQSLNQSLVASATFLLPCYTDPLAKLLFSDPRNFKGSSLIDQNDLRCLNGNGKTDDENFLFNFITDEYLLQKPSEANGLKRKVLLWEQFERGSLSMLARLFQKMERLKIKT